MASAKPSHDISPNAKPSPIDPDERGHGPGTVDDSAEFEEAAGYRRPQAGPPRGVENRGKP